MTLAGTPVPNEASDSGWITADPVLWVLVTLTDVQHRFNDHRDLQVDRFGLSIGSVSVGLPICGTADDIFARYLDLLRILQRGPLDLVEPPVADLEALAEASSTDCAFVAQRLRSLLAGR